MSVIINDCNGHPVSVVTQAECRIISREFNFTKKGMLGNDTVMQANEAKYEVLIEIICNLRGCKDVKTIS